MKTSLKRINGTWYLVFPYEEDADKWEILLGTILRRKRTNFCNYQNAYRII